jgi:class 3 adenylate cyclase
MLNIAFKNKKLTIGALLSGLYISLSCLTIGLDILRAYFFEGKFQDQMIQSLVEGNLQKQKALIGNFMYAPLKIIHQCKWSIQSSVTLHDRSILFQILSGMKFSDSIEKVSLSLVNDDVLEVSRMKDHVDQERQNFRCMSSQKTSEGFLIRDMSYTKTGKKIKSDSFLFPGDVAKMRKSFSIFSFYDDMDSLPRFDEIKRSRDPLWLPPLETFGPDQGLFISLVSPLLDAQDSFIGLITVYIPVNKFTDLMKELVSQKAFELAGLFSSRGEAICFSHPDLLIKSVSKGYDGEKSMNNISYHGISKIYENYVHQGHPSFMKLDPSRSNGHTQDIVYFYKLGSQLHSDWTLMSIANYQDLLKGSSDLFMISLKIILGISILAIGSIFFMTRTIGAPLQKISRHLSQLSQFQTPPPLKIESRFKELKDIVSSSEIVDKNFSIFYRLIPLTLCKFLSSKQQEISVGGSSVTATSFFCDMAGFTHLAEEMPPENVLSYLSQYFQYATTLVEKNNGIVQQYIGDAVFASWGDLLSIDDHELMACRCALQCVEAFSSQLNPLFLAEGLPSLYVTFGIASGHVLAGMMGSSDHLQYSLIGENATLAQTLQECNRNYGTQILVQESVYDRVSPSFILRPVDLIPFGDHQVMIYELMADLNDSESKDLSELSYQAVQTQKAWLFYAAKNWDSAKDIYESLLKQFPHDKLAATMHERCCQFSDPSPASQKTQKPSRRSQEKKS